MFALTGSTLLRDLVRLLAVMLAAASIARADPVITEFMASNSTSLADDDGAFSDWVEIFNPDDAPVDLGGWYLTDSATAKTKWQFPAVILPSNGYLVVFASNKNRRDPTRPLHTNFALSADGEYLGLIQPDGETVASEFAPSFPAQRNDVSYGLVSPAGGGAAVASFLSASSPGTANGASALPQAAKLSRPAGPFSAPFTLELTGAGPGQHIRYLLGPPSEEGARIPEPTAESTRYTGPIRIEATVIVSAAVFSSDDSVRGPSASAHYVELSPALGTFSTSLPVLVLDNHGLGGMSKDGIDHPATIYVYEPTGTGPVFGAAPKLSSPMTMTVRGNFTATFPKRSFNITLMDDKGGKRPQSLLGLAAADDWAVVSPWSTDLAYIRNAYVYALSNQIGRWAPRTRFVEMFVNDSGDGLDPADYYGIGVVTDRLKVGKDRIAITSLEPNDNAAPAITGGYVIKFDPVPDETHYNFITDHGIPISEGTGVVVDTPNGGKLSEPQRDYIRDYVQRMENALYADQSAGYATRTYLDYIDVASWIDHHVLELFTGNVDALYRSDYFHKDRGGKLVSGPAWDFDGSMGHGDPRNANWNTWDTAGGVDLWNYGWWGLLTRDPEFMQAWVDRWQTLRRKEFSTQSLRSLADSFAAQIGPEAAARDVVRWSDNEGRFPGGFLGEVSHLKDWITRRAAWIDEQFLAAPTVTVTGASLRIVPPDDARLAYTLDGSDPRALGGRIAPNARFSAGPLEVPASANVHARSYRPELAEVFPGSPWSAAVGGEKSSPLTPRARLSNLSSRGTVGSGEHALIVGIGVADTAAKKYLARAVGPGLGAFGVTGFVPDPLLTISSADGRELLRNQGWQTGDQVTQLTQISKSLGAFPLSAESTDSALVGDLGAGTYALEVTTPSGQAGTGLTELYEADANGRTTNLSTRVFLRGGDGGYVGGFVVTGPAYKRMLLRAVGPTLGTLGVAECLPDSVLTVFSGQNIVATNDRWDAGENAVVVAAAAKSVGAFALVPDSEDAALLVTLPPGAYTVEVKGHGDAEGLVLFEIYDVP